MRIIPIFIILLFILKSSSSFGNVFPEHREVTLLGINKLTENEIQALNSYWQSARLGYESRLSAKMIDKSLNKNTTTIDLASWPAIGGDHTCSPDDLLNTILSSQWIVKVSQIAAVLGKELKKAGEDGYKRNNALRVSDSRFLFADPQYATRAGSNNVHFLLPIAHPEVELEQYLESCLDSSSESNGLASYTYFHYLALLKAQELNNIDLSSSARSEAIRQILALETFALHFIQDAFAAGHIAGSWGATSKRKGTHDFYNEKGLKVNTWEGDSFVLLGDAWMRDIDADKASDVVAISLRQLISALEGESNISSVKSMDEGFDVCANDNFPLIEYPDDYKQLLNEVAIKTPIPGLVKGYGEMPRFNSEVGPFVGVNAATSGSTHWGGYLENQTDIGAIGNISIGLRFGVGLEGVLNESSDGLIFLDVGLSNNGATTAKFNPLDDAEVYGAISTQIPARTSTYFRLRVPYWLVPGDLVVAAPFLSFISPNTLTSMGVVASNGGLLGLQSGMDTWVGRFQFVLGREVGLHLYTSDRDGSRAFAIGEENGEPVGALIDIDAIQLEFPFLEYRLFRTFSSDQSSDINMQLYLGVDIPLKIDKIFPVNGTIPASRNIYSVGMKFNLNWRKYLEI